MKKEKIILFVGVLLTVFLVTGAALAETVRNKNEDTYALVHMISLGIAIRGLSFNEVGMGYIEEDNHGNFLTSLSLSECQEHIADKLMDRRGSSFKYVGRGVYTLEGAYGRFLCIDQKELINRYSDDSWRAIDFDFLEQYPKEIPLVFNEKEIESYTLFPLNKDQKEAREITNKLDEYMKEKTERIWKTSFDCSQDLAPRERLICTDEKLASLDIKANDLYEQVLKKYQKDQTAIEKLQAMRKKWDKRWISYPLGIEDMFLKRIDFLNCLIEKSMEQCTPPEK